MSVEESASGVATFTSLDPIPPDPSSLVRNSSFSKLNAQAPAFVPRTSSSPSAALVHVYATPVPPALVQNHFLYPPPLQYYAPEVVVASTPALTDVVDHGGLTDEAALKIINQVEFYFSDLNLATTDHLIKHMLKDPEGYVPISVVSLFKKIKALVNSNTQLAQVLRGSTKLVVSEDGKKVKRRIPLTEGDLEELQSRIVVAENLPEDHCHQNLMKIFSAVGSVKMIRTCQPQSSSGGASSASRTAKSDSQHYSNKLHTFVEYESVELAERAVAELNDEDNWRNALKVRLLLRRAGNSGQSRGKRVGHENEHNFKEDDSFALEVKEKFNEDPRHHLDVQPHELAEERVSDGPRKGRGRARGRGKGQGLGQVHGRPQFPQNNRGGHAGGAPMPNVNPGSSVTLNIDHVCLVQPIFDQSAAAAKQSSVPRMPDGTKGFSMGRGKPVAIRTA